MREAGDEEREGEREKKRLILTLFRCCLLWDSFHFASGMNASCECLCCWFAVLAKKIGIFLLV